MILVTGGTGFLGQNLQETLTSEEPVYYANSVACDLRSREASLELFNSLKPSKVIHLAGLVGGIKANSERQYGFLYDNLRINSNVVDACVRFKTPHLLALSSVCVYPRALKEKDYPLSLKQLYDGPPEYTNAGYAHAKRMMQSQIDAARSSHNLRASVVYPANLYGPHDHFGEYGAHVIPDLIYKMHEAKINKASSVKLYGTGKAYRQFTYVADLCQVIQNISKTEYTADYNFYSTDNISISALAELVKEIVGYQGELEFSGQLDGQMRRDVTRDISIENITSLKVGLTKTYTWFLNAINNDINTRI